MTEPVQIPATEIRQCLDEESLRDWVQHQRWYASKSRAVTGIEIVEAVALSEDPPLFLALVQTRFATGTHELYQLPLALRPSDEDVGAAGAIARTREWTAYDALAEPARLLELVLRHGLGRARSRPPRAASASTAPTGVATVAEDATVRADRRRAVELLARDRRSARAEGVPQARAGRQPRARDAPLPHRAGLPQHRGAARLVRLRRPGAGRDAGRRAAIPARRGRRLGARAGARSRPSRSGSSISWAASAR